jgi:anti-sigma factor RsiW
MRPDLNQHVPEEILDELALDMLHEQDCAVWEEHLLICEACQDRLAETDEYIQTMKEAAAAIRNGRGLAKPVAVASHA